MHHLCTYFDRNYLARALALRASLRGHGVAFRLWALCMDDAAYDALVTMALPDVVPLRLGDLEAWDRDLAATRATRSRIEYYFTCSPALPLFVFAQDAAVDCVTYLDADLFFYADPAPLFAAQAEASIALVEHRFCAGGADLARRFGRFNVAWLSFRRDAQGLACLQRWRTQCIEWCHDREEPGRYADQKYLDEWPNRYSNVVIIDHPGANLAPWNLATHHLEPGADALRVDGRPLIFFHFHGVKQVGPRLFETGLREPVAALVLELYPPYLRLLAGLDRALFARLGRASGSESIRGAAAAPVGWRDRLRRARGRLALYRTRMRRLRRGYCVALWRVPAVDPSSSTRTLHEAMDR